MSSRLARFQREAHAPEYFVVPLYLWEEILEFLEDHMDADVQGDPPEYVPNRAMGLLGTISEEGLEWEGE
jgi:hypothetical protein